MKKFKLLALLGIILGVIFVNQTKCPSFTNKYIVMENIEALASNEGIYSQACVYNGSMECNDHNYVRLVIQNLEEETVLQ